MTDDPRETGAGAEDAPADPVLDEPAPEEPTERSVDPSGAASSPAKDRPKRRLPWWGEAGLILVAAVVLAILVKTFVAQVFYIPSASMEPGLQTGDRIVVQKWSYSFGREPSRGDVIVFKDPGGWLGNDESSAQGTSGFTGLLADVGLFPSGGHLVKRVIGVPGDRIECCDEQGRILVNGVPLDEDDYIAPRGENVQCNGPMIATCEWTAGPVPEGELFVMGDNRADSEDSTTRICVEGETDCTRDPYVDDDDVVGKVLAVAWPTSHFRFLGDPDSFDDVPDGE